VEMTKDKLSHRFGGSLLYNDNVTPHRRGPGGSLAPKLYDHSRALSFAGISPHLSA
jgi:hypothetical protein